MCYGWPMIPNRSETGVIAFFGIGGVLPGVIVTR